MIPLLGIAGLAGSGKDTAGRYLCERYGFERWAFADPIRAAVAAVLDWPVSDIEPQKDVPVPGLGVSPRQLMQAFGTEGGRTLKRNLWLLVMERRLHQRLRAADRPRGIVVTDVRMENEGDWIRARGLLVHIERRPPPAVPAHATELGVSRKERDLYVPNKSTLSVLHHLLDQVMSDRFPELLRAV